MERRFQFDEAYWGQPPEVRKLSENLILAAECAQGPDAGFMDGYFLPRLLQQCRTCATELRKLLQTKYDGVVDGLENDLVAAFYLNDMKRLAYIGLPEAILQYVIHDIQFTSEYEKHEEYIWLLEIAVRGGFPNQTMEDYGNQLLGSLCFSYGKHLKYLGMYQGTVYLKRAAELNNQEAIAELRPVSQFDVLYKDTGLVLADTHEKIYQLGDTFVTESGREITP